MSGVEAARSNLLIQYYLVSCPFYGRAYTIYYYKRVSLFGEEQIFVLLSRLPGEFARLSLYTAQEVGGKRRRSLPLNSTKKMLSLEEEEEEKSAIVLQFYEVKGHRMAKKTQLLELRMTSWSVRVHFQGVRERERERENRVMERRRRRSD